MTEMTDEEFQALSPDQRAYAERHWGQVEIASFTLGAMFGFRVADGLMTLAEAEAHLREATFRSPHAQMIAEEVANAIAKGEGPPRFTVIDGGKPD